jgi:hypothetical protein
MVVVVNKDKETLAKPASMAIGIESGARRISADPERMERIHDRFDALRTQIVKAYADLPAEQGMAEIDVCVTRLRSADAGRV